MADLTNRKATNRPGNPPRDLDAMLDEAELSITPLDNPEEDEDAIDRLLMDAGFDTENEPSRVIDESVVTDEYDEFGDDFDLTGMSADAPISDVEINPADELKKDAEFPLDLLDSIVVTTDEQPDTFTALGGDEEATAEPLNALPKNEIDQPAAEATEALDESNLTDQLEEFSDFDEFSDFQELQEPEIIEDNHDEAALTAAADSDETKKQQAQPATMAYSEENDFIVDVAELAALDQTPDYDEFGDDEEDYLNSVSASAPSVNPDQSQPTENEATPATVNTDDIAASADFNITADFEDDLINGSDQAETWPENPVAQDVEPELSPHETIADATTPQQTSDNAFSPADAASLAALMQFKSEQESINKKYKKDIADSAANAKKVPMMTYVALGFALVSLIAAVVLGVMAYGAKTELAKLTESATASKNTGAVATNNSNPVKPNTVPNPTEPKADENIHSLAAKPDSSPDTAKHEPSSTPETDDHAAEAKAALHDPKTDVVTPENSASLIEKPHAAIEPPHHDQAAPSTASHPTENKPVEPPQETIAAATTNTALSEPKATPDDTEKNKIPTTPEKKPETEHPSSEKKEAKTITEKKKTPVAMTKKTAAKKKPTPVTAAANWSVNLIAFKDQWYAGSKAAEFAQKGVPVEIVPVRIGNVTRYRLRVPGFSDKEEAAAYKRRVEKALNLSGVWVDKK